MWGSDPSEDFLMRSYEIMLFRKKLKNIILLFIFIKKCFDKYPTKVNGSTPQFFIN